MKLPILKRILLILGPVALLSLSSCRVLFPNEMLVAKRDYPFDTLNLDSSKFSTEYRLAADDIFEFKLFANDGFKMIDLIAGGGINQNNMVTRQSYEYTLDARGEAKLPILGMVKLDSMTIREAEAFLEKEYSRYYVKPFAIVKIVNRRVIIFPGDPGTAKVLQLTNNNTTVFEAIAMAGGITANGKAKKVLLIRQTENPNDPLVYKLNLSRIENLPQGNIVLQSNDVIYVQPRRRYATKTLQEVTPIMALLSSTITVYVLLARL